MMMVIPSWDDCGTVVCMWTGSSSIITTNTGGKCTSGNRGRCSQWWPSVWLRCECRRHKRGGSLILKAQASSPLHRQIFKQNLIDISVMWLGLTKWVSGEPDWLLVSWSCCERAKFCFLTDCSFRLRSDERSCSSSRVCRSRLTRSSLPSAFLLELLLLSFTASASTSAKLHYPLIKEQTGPPIIIHTFHFVLKSFDFPQSKISLFLQFYNFSHHGGGSLFLQLSYLLPHRLLHDHERALLWPHALLPHRRLQKRQNMYSKFEVLMDVCL